MNLSGTRYKSLDCTHLVQDTVRCKVRVTNTIINRQVRWKLEHVSFICAASGTSKAILLHRVNSLFQVTCEECILTQKGPLSHFTKFYLLCIETSRLTRFCPGRFWLHVVDIWTKILPNADNFKYTTVKRGRLLILPRLKLQRQLPTHCVNV
jgi:hypothetical protein